MPVTFFIINGIFIGAWLWGLVLTASEMGVFSIYVPDPISLIYTFICLTTGILTLLTTNAARKKGISSIIGILWISGGIAVIGSSVFYFIYFDLFLIYEIIVGLYVLFFSGISLVMAGVLLAKGTLLIYVETEQEGLVLKERTFYQKKYRCIKCGFKTSKLPFQPTECPKCEGTVFQVI